MSRGGPDPPGRDTPASAEILAPAKLTLSLRIVGVRADGYHLLQSEMVSIDLADTLVLTEGEGFTVTVALDGSAGAEGRRAGERPAEDDRWPDVDAVPLGPDNLVSRALAAVGRQARVHLVKRIPPGAGLGGGSADAAAVLRWAGRRDPEVASALGADVPFCLRGGRAMVRGIGEDVDPLPYEDRAFTLLLLPFGMDTSAVYRTWDTMAGSAPRSGGAETGNELESAAVQTDSRLDQWKRALSEASGRVPRLAGSGSTWFVEGTRDELGLTDRFVQVGDERGRLVEVRTVPPR